MKGRDRPGPGDGAGLGRGVRVARSLGSCPQAPGGSPRPSPQSSFPPDPALTRPGLGQDQDPKRSRRRVRGPMTRILWVWEEAESGQVGGDFVIGIRGDADWFF